MLNATHERRWVGIDLVCGHVQLFICLFLSKLGLCFLHLTTHLQTRFRCFVAFMFGCFFNLQFWTKSVILVIISNSLWKAAYNFLKKVTVFAIILGLAHSPSATSTPRIYSQEISKVCQNSSVSQFETTLSHAMAAFGVVSSAGQVSKHLNNSFKLRWHRVLFTYRSEFFLLAIKKEPSITSWMQKLRSTWVKFAANFTWDYSMFACCLKSWINWQNIANDENDQLRTMVFEVNFVN